MLKESQYPKLWKLWLFGRNVDDPTLKAIAKWRNHPSILATAPEYKNRANFSFSVVSKEDVLAEIKVLNVSKAI